MPDPGNPEPTSSTYRSNVVTAAPSPSTVIGGVGSIGVTVTVDQPGGSVSIDTDSRSVLNSPSGFWPYTYQFASGQGTSGTITLTTNAVQANVTASIRACDAQLNIGDPGNWQAVCSVTVTG